MIAESTADEATRTAQWARIRGLVDAMDTTVDAQDA